MYAFDYQIAYYTDCNKTHHRANPISDPKCEYMVNVTDAYSFPILNGEIRYEFFLNLTKNSLRYIIVIFTMSMTKRHINIMLHVLLILYNII